MTIGRFLSLVSQPLALLSSVGAVVAFFWLTVLGEWRPLLLGVVALMLMPEVLYLLDKPGLALTKRVHAAMPRRPRLAAAGSFAAVVWTSTLQVAWISGVAAVTFAAVDAHNTLPLMVWGYTVAVGPLSFLATRMIASASMSMLALTAEFYAITLGIAWALGAHMVHYAIFGVIALLIVPVCMNALGAVATYFE